MLLGCLRKHQQLQHGEATKHQREHQFGRCTSRQGLPPRVTQAWALVLQALMPVAVFIVGCAFKTEKFSTNVFGNMLVVSLGVAIASYGEAGWRPLSAVIHAPNSCACPSWQLPADALVPALSQ